MSCSLLLSQSTLKQLLCEILTEKFIDTWKNLLDLALC